MLYIIGIGLNERGISKQGLLALEKCKKVYLESYTVDFPYSIGNLHLSKKIIPLKRRDVESNKLIKEAKSRKIALLVYGSPLFATTHMSLIIDAKEQDVNVRVIYSASVFDAIAETGLQLYKFGKITSMPDWKDKGKSDFLKYVKENQSIKAHSLILVDIGLGFNQALEQLEQAADSEKDGKNEKISLDKIIVCSRLGTDEKQVLYDTIDNLKQNTEINIQAPFCFIIPSELHFLEKDVLEGFD